MLNYGKIQVKHSKKVSPCRKHFDPDKSKISTRWKQPFLTLYLFWSRCPPLLSLSASNAPKKKQGGVGTWEQHYTNL